MTHRIGVIHATRHSLQPIAEAFAALWPEAEPMNLLDETLLADRRAAGELTPALHDRIVALARHSVESGARCVLYSCSAFGAAIEAAKGQVDVPVLRPYEAMIETALKRGERLGLLATFGATIKEMSTEIQAVAGARGVAVALKARLAEGGLDALTRGDRASHDRAIAAAAEALTDVDALLLAQYSMAPAATLISDVPGRDVLTAPECAVEKVRALLTG
jgi:hypothetical protein